jgi:hypothetical protein
MQDVGQSLALDSIGNEEARTNGHEGSIQAEELMHASYNSTWLKRVEKAKSNLLCLLFPCDHAGLCNEDNLLLTFTSTISVEQASLYCSASSLEL